VQQSRDPRASVILTDEEFAELDTLLEKVTQTASQFAPGWAARASVASMGDEPEEEIVMSSAKAAVNAGAADPTVAVALYYMHQQLAEQTKAREQLEQALGTYPGSLEVLNYLAQAYYLAGDYEKTLEVWNDYLKHVPKSAHAARRRDRLLSRLGRKDEAVKNATALVAEHPGSVPTIAALAERQIDAGKMQEAQVTLAKALEKSPNHPLLLTRLSFVELENGSEKEALALAEKAVSLIGDGRGEPLAGYAHIDLARAQAIAGQKEKAKKTLRTALRLGVGGDDIVRLANDPRLEGFIKLPLVLDP
ncbi:MAG: tetratricopeptide repeat protein, partial [Myxococcota bacterium]